MKASITPVDVGLGSASKYGMRSTIDIGNRVCWVCVDYGTYMDNMGVFIRIMDPFSRLWTNCQQEWHTIKCAYL